MSAPASAATVDRVLAVFLLLIGPAAGADEPDPSWLDRVDGRVFTHSEADSLIRDLPSGRSVWSLLETLEAPAVLDRIEGAGLYPGEPGRFSMRGASWTQNRVLLD